MPNMFPSVAPVGLRGGPVCVARGAGSGSREGYFGAKGEGVSHAHAHTYTYRTTIQRVRAR